MPTDQISINGKIYDALNEIALGLELSRSDCQFDGETRLTKSR